MIKICLFDKNYIDKFVLLVSDLALAHHQPEEVGVAVGDVKGRKGQGHHVIDVGGQGHVTAGEDFE